MVCPVERPVERGESGEERASVGRVDGRRVVGRRWRVWSAAERRAALSGLLSGGAAGRVRALVGGVGGSVSSVLLAVAESVEWSVVCGDPAALSEESAAVRAAWRLGASCPRWSEEWLSEALSEELGRPASAEEESVVEGVLSFVWVDASRRWVVLPPGVGRRAAVARAAEALLSGALSSESVVEAVALCPAERLPRR